MKTRLIKSSISVLVLSIALLFFPAISSMAQEEAVKEEKWNFAVAPYLLFPNMSGETTIKGIPIDASANAKDIYSNINLGGMLYVEASNAIMTFILDGYYVALGAEGVTPLLSRSATVDLNQIAVSLYGMYRLNSWAEVGIGGRFNSIGSTVTIAPGEYVLPGSEFSMDEGWFDPLIVARVMTQFNESKWRLGLMADFGGFGLGSNYAYQFNLFAGYQFLKWFEIDVAYRLNGMKYETGSGTDLFIYDVMLYGPALGLVFHF